MNEFTKLSINITNNLSAKDKKNDGIFFTPNSIINSIFNYLSNYIEDNNIKIKNILEPSCGSCQFINYIDNIYSNIKIDCIEKNTEIYNNIKKS